MIVYQVEQNLAAEEFVKVLNTSTLAERRPVADAARIAKMLQNANLVVTARLNNELIGVARSISDFSFCTYLSDLAVDLVYQKQGIGRELIKHTKLAAPDAKLILLSAPAAIHYYPRIGMKRHDYCYYIDDVMELQ
ncbi:MAG: GNAT family N-acetyltransferase [Bacteroidetes bacterium]|nr:GNAT family N-acetyltransferase [Bacteroidota bacterium]